MCLQPEGRPAAWGGECGGWKGTKLCSRWAAMGGLAVVPPYMVKGALMCRKVCQGGKSAQTTCTVHSVKRLGESSLQLKRCCLDKK